MGGSTNKAERLVAVFLLGVMLFNYPLLAVFNRAVEVMGIPLVYVYIFTAWGASDRPSRAHRQPALSFDHRSTAHRPMLNAWVIIPVALAYVGILFAIAYYGDTRADRGRSIIANPYIYAVSLGVYATAWTFYGSVGRAAADGVGFLPDLHRPDADDRAVVAGDAQDHPHQQDQPHHLARGLRLVALRQERAARRTGDRDRRRRRGARTSRSSSRPCRTASPSCRSRRSRCRRSAAAIPIHADTAFWMAVLLATFTILFGTRHLDASERHEGLVAAIAFESLVKLVAFLAVGVFVTYGMYNGLGDLFQRAAGHPRLAGLFAPAGRPCRQLRQLGMAHGAVDARDHVPSTPIPDRRGRERRRAPCEHGGLAVPACTCSR